MTRRIQRRGATKTKDIVEEVVNTREELRREARERLGVTGSNETPPPLRATIANHGLSFYPLIALSALALADTFHFYAFAVLAPDISRTLGIDRGSITAVLAVKTVASALSPLPIAALVQRVPRRAVLSTATGIAWSLVAIWTGSVTLIWGLLIALALDGLTTGSVGSLHRPILMDAYPPQARVRSLSYYQAADSVGNVTSPLIVALLSTVMLLTWRGVFVVLGLISLGVALLALKLRDPGFGRWDDKQVRQTVHQRRGEATEALPDEHTSLGFFEIVRRLLLISTVRRLLVAYAVFGVLLIPFQTFLFFFLEERWGMGPGARGLFFAMFSGAGVVALTLFGKRAEALFRESPTKVIQLSSLALAAGVVIIAIAALVPIFGVMLALFALAAGLLAILGPAQGIALLSVIPSHMRPHAAALSGIFLGGVGGLSGAIFLGGIDRRFGIAGSIVSLIVPGVIGSLILYSTGKLVPRDLDRMIDEIIEDEEVKRLHSAGSRLPMLACRHIDFSYGPLQVLFDVNFTVDDGEMVALLGTNGAGKSTLLRAISGLGLPSRGSVRFRGAEITYLDAERRLRLGITQIPGGRAVFWPMSVADNLRAFGFTMGRDRRALDQAIDSAFEAFPRLAERRHQPASTLSGGEQQMLGLSKALILRPKLLLIDELSLGLAPVIVENLLHMVRRINEDGTSIVLVEQSVNIALSVVEHAYFMEKGEIRFDGAAQDLLQRDDLLRAVFLDGVSPK